MCHAVNIAHAIWKMWGKPHDEKMYDAILLSELPGCAFMDPLVRKTSQSVAINVAETHSSRIRSPVIGIGLISMDSNSGLACLSCVVGFRLRTIVNTQWKSTVPVLTFRIRDMNAAFTEAIIHKNNGFKGCKIDNGKAESVRGLRTICGMNCVSTSLF